MSKKADTLRYATQMIERLLVGYLSEDTATAQTDTLDAMRLLARYRGEPLNTTKRRIAGQIEMIVRSERPAATPDDEWWTRLFGEQEEVAA